MHSLMVTVCVALATLTGEAEGHGYMVEPPSRQSAARVGYRFVPWNPNDNQQYCGGKEHQWDVNGGRCGVCGDPWDQRPRDYEHPDGLYVRGVAPVNKVYARGQVLETAVRLTKSHLGYFVFRICNRDNLNAPDATDECLQENVLRLADVAGEVTQYKLPGDCDGVYKVKVQLPTGLTCEKCFFQWKYHAGNDYGCYANGGPCCLGCGERQEEFYACADIVIRNGVAVTPPPRGVNATCALGAPSPSPATPTTTAAGTASTATPSTATPSPSFTESSTATTGDLERRCRGQGSSCSVYCRPGGLLSLCRLIPECRGCQEYLSDAGSPVAAK